MKHPSSPAPKALYLIAAFAVFVGQASESEVAPTRTLITGVTSFDGTSEKLIAGKSVLVEGNKIKSIAADIRAPEGATVIDGKIYKNTLR